MTAIDRNRNIAAGTATVFVWIFLVVLFSLFSLLPKKQVFKTVKIQLDAPSTPKIAEKVEAAPSKVEAEQTAPVAQAPAPAKTPVKESPKAAAKPAAKPVQKTESKPAAQPAQKPAAKPAEQVIQKTVEERMAEQRSTKKAKKEVNWDEMFGDDSSESVSSSNTPAVSGVTGSSNSFEGSAASSAKTATGSSSASSSAKTSNAQVSSATAAALGDIAAASYTATAGNGVTSTASVTQASSTDGRISMVMNDGSNRILLEPKTPVLKLSDAAAATIDTRKDLRISFTVRPDGHVDINSVQFTPSTIVGSLVKNEIADQISRWRFNADSGSATASFRHTIKTN